MCIELDACFHLEKQQGYCIISFCKAPANTLSIAEAIRLAEIFDELGRQEDIRAIILTGGIKFSFCTGSELNEISEIMLREGSVSDNMVYDSRKVQEAFSKIESCPKVTIAAVNGLAIGLGFELALVCDIRIASELAWFKMAQTGIGIIPGAGGTQRLPRIIGMPKAKEIILTGRKVTAKEALQLGLINEAVPHGSELKRSVEIAKAIAEQTSSNAVRLAKAAIMEGLYLPLQVGLDREMELFGETYKYNGAFEGIKAVMDKRKPDFKEDTYAKG